MNAMPSIRIVTINVLHMKEGMEKRARVIGQELAALNPDVVLLQEVAFEDREGSSFFLDTLVKYAGIPVAVVNPVDLQSTGLIDGSAILSRFPVLESGEPEQAPAARHRTSYAVLETPGGRALAAFSIHGAWGGDRTFDRERQMIALNNHANVLEKRYAQAGIVSVLGGDLNCIPDSSPIRFLTGRQSLEGTSTYWVDCWEATGEGEGSTSTPEIPASIHMAKLVGIGLFEAMPYRRIDYILVKGWAHGRPGTPLSTSLCMDLGDDTPSDHYGVMTDLWWPELE
jgi:endonuclease/exonuclease/phosphatase family metal-dependent hydrolase